MATSFVDLLQTKATLEAVLKKYIYYSNMINRYLILFANIRARVFFFSSPRCPYERGATLIDNSL